jgi:SagB-type dehydrogenase family enzyme
MENLRQYLKNPALEVLENAGESDQRKGVAAPPLEKPIPDNARRIALIPQEETGLGAVPLARAIGDRRSRRAYTEDALSLAELSFLLWATQGIREVHPKKIHAFRTVPSGGCRHPYETYLRVNNVEGVPSGLWRYSALEHALVLVWEEPAEGSPSLADICYGQGFVDKAAVTFVWTAIPYRTAWRYGPDSLKDILISCGHICQNLYLACEDIGAGTCAILAYDQAKLDPYLGVDGIDEISLYVAPVGKVAVD